MFTQLDPRLTAHAVFTAERNARAQKSQYQVLFPNPGDILTDEVFVCKWDDADTRYTVTLSLDSKRTPTACTCKFFQKNAICKHQYLCVWEQDSAAENAMVADLYEREEAREFMLTSSIEHNVNFAADVMADTAAEFDPEPYDNQTDYADGWH